MTPTDTPNLLQWVALYQFYCITAEEDLQIKTSRTLLKLVLCSKLTNLPLQHEYEVEMDNYQFSKNHIIIMSTSHACYL